MTEQETGDDRDDREGGERNPKKLWAALIELVRSYSTYYRAKIQNAENPKASPEGLAAIFTAIGTCVGAILAGVAAWVFYCQLGVMQHTDSKIGEQADTLYEALVGVERPVLLVTMPKEFAYDSDNIDPTRPMYAVEAKNVGKQIANFVEADASFIVQKDATPPKPAPMGKYDETYCPVYFIGDFSAGPGESVGFGCQRHAALTPEQIAGIDNQTLFGFFRISFLYTDPVGTTRLSTFIFRQSPPVSSATFIRLLGADQILKKLSPEARNEAVRTYIGKEIKSQADTARRRKPNP